jgi:putative FmdB family regulatory protein
MPLYEYECRKHGVFEQLGSIAERVAPRPCPDCNRPAARVLSATQQPALERTTRVAHERNERSRHEPRMVTRQAPAAAPVRDRPPVPKPQRAHGSGRPWMIGH